MASSFKFVAVALLAIVPLSAAAQAPWTTTRFPQDMSKWWWDDGWWEQGRIPGAAANHEVATRTASYRSGDADVPVEIFAPKGAERSPVVVFLHGRRGIDPVTRLAPLRLAARGLVVVAPDLYAGRWQSFRKVLLPLTLPGIIAGSIIVFIPSLGAYVTPDLMGGARVSLLGNLLQQQFMTVRDWPFGSAISFIMMAVMLAATLVYFRVSAEEERMTDLSALVDAYARPLFEVADGTSWYARFVARAGTFAPLDPPLDAKYTSALRAVTDLIRRALSELPANLRVERTRRMQLYVTTAIADVEARRARQETLTTSLDTSLRDLVATTAAMLAVGPPVKATSARR